MLDGATVIPCPALRAPHISCKLRSGRRATNSTAAVRCALRRERRSPPIARAAACPSVRNRCPRRIGVLTLNANWPCRRARRRPGQRQRRIAPLRASSSRGGDIIPAPSIVVAPPFSEVG